MSRHETECGELDDKAGKGFYDWACKDMAALEAKRDHFIVETLKILKQCQQGSAMQGKEHRRLSAPILNPYNLERAEHFKDVAGESISTRYGRMIPLCVADTVNTSYLVMAREGKYCYATNELRITKTMNLSRRSLSHVQQRHTADSKS